MGDARRDELRRKIAKPCAPTRAVPGSIRESGFASERQAAKRGTRSGIAR
jgi:hypothetical protein